MNTPWSVAPLGGKYYGTHVLDRDGKELFTIWEIPWHDPEMSAPSEREGDLEVYDSHYEGVLSYLMASTIVERINSA